MDAHALVCSKVGKPPWWEAADILLPTRSAHLLAHVPHQVISEDVDAKLPESGERAHTHRRRMQRAQRQRSSNHRGRAGVTCTSPKALFCSSATVTSSTRSASVIVPHASNSVFISDCSSLSEHLVSRISSSDA